MAHATVGGTAETGRPLSSGLKILVASVGGGWEAVNCETMNCYIYVLMFLCFYMDPLIFCILYSRFCMCVCNIYYVILHYITLYCIVLRSILFYSILFYSILFYSILFSSILFSSLLFYSLLFSSILFYSLLFSSILFYSLLFYSLLFYCICLCYIICSNDMILHCTASCIVFYYSYIIILVLFCDALLLFSFVFIVCLKSGGCECSDGASIWWLFDFMFQVD